MFTKSLLEKYSFQQQEGIITDLFYQDMQDMTKLAYPLMFCLYKYGCFILTRLLKLKVNKDSKNIFVNYIFCDTSHPSYMSNIQSVSMVNVSNSTPENCGGFASGNVVVIYLPMSAQYLPFGYRNTLMKDNVTLSESDSVEIIRDISNKYVTAGYTVDVTSPESIDVKGLLSKFKTPTEMLNRYYVGQEWKLKEPKKLPINTKQKLSDLLHEITHILDWQTSNKVNQFTPTNTSNLRKAGLSSNISSDDNTVTAFDILYRLWSKTEFNAYAASYGRPDLLKRSLKTDIKLKSKDDLLQYVDILKDKINKLSSVNDLEFWGNIKSIAAAGNNISSTKERIQNMSDQKFKTYFLQTSYKLLDKFKDNVLKKSAQQTLYNKDTQTLAKEIRNKINDNLSKYEYDANEKFIFTATVLVYFPSESYSYPVTISIQVDPSVYKFAKSNRRAFNSEAHVVLSCSKLKYRHVLTSNELNSLTSFYDLYIELLTKQRRSYLDKLAFSIADDIQSLISQY